VLDGSAAVPAIEASFTLGGIQVQPLLSDAAGFSRLEGGGATDIAISGRGASQRQIVGSLNGKGSFAFTDGAINGFNLAAMLRNVTTAFTAGAANEKTDFASLKASYQITNGILKNDDLEMLAPLFRVNGAGTVDLPKRTVDYTITPKVVATAEGQGGNKDLGGVMVPVIVQGPWDKLSYRPDLEALLKQKLDPKKALDALTGAGGKAPVKPKELLKGLFGN
jgi:AsmA protein